MIGSVTFASIFSAQFGSYVKEWRLFADVINDAALTLDMMSAFLPPYMYLPTISLSAVFKSMCGISAGASKLCIVNHLTLRNNAADLAAKENTQETFVSLVGLILGYFIARVIQDGVVVNWVLFTFFTLVHVYSNYKAVSCLKLTFLNRTRAWLLMRQYLLCNRDELDTQKNMSIGNINNQDTLYMSLRVAYFGPAVGVSATASFLSQLYSADRNPASEEVTRRQALRLINIFEGDPYMVLPPDPSQKSRRWSLLLSETSTKVQICSSGGMGKRLCIYLP